MPTYMVIETFKDGSLEQVYERFHARGRMTPPGLHYVDSWLASDGDRCFQLMRTDEPALFDAWVRKWDDLVSFEIVEIGPKPGA